MVQIIHNENGTVTRRDDCPIGDAPGMKQHEEVGLTLVATPVLREAVSKLEDMMELAAADMLMEPKGTEYNSDLWLLIGKLKGSLHTPNYR